MNILIKKHEKNWSKDFLDLQAKLKKILGPYARSIDHIGSTAIPGLGAKDVVDIQVTVDELSAEIKYRLEAAGCVFNSSAFDHVPFGADSSPHLWKKFLASEPLGMRRANIHIRIYGNPNQKYALLFRDYLLAHPEVVPTLELIKVRISALTQDMDTYVSIKDPIYDLLIIAAEEWVQSKDQR